MQALLFILLAISSLAWATPDLDAEFKRMLKTHGLTPQSEQTYCYEQAQVVQGVSVSKPQRIASLTKILTSLMVSETMDLTHKFTTKFHLGNDGLHIEGGNDPYFEEEKILLLMKALHSQGYKKLKQITFDENFQFYDIALGSYLEITQGLIRARIAFYFNPKNAKAIREKWQTVLNFAKEEGVYLDPTLPLVSVEKVRFAKINPFLQENPQVYTHSSKPLHSLMKSMNVMSKNLVAQNLYLLALKVKSVSEFMSGWGFHPSIYKIYNGSGLPMVNGNSRLDNLLSCEGVLKVMKLFDLSVQKQNFHLSDVMAVTGGKDLGSFRSRFGSYPQTHDAVIAKTGTLMHSSALGGFLFTDEQIPFAVLNHTTNTANARSFQEAFVASMFDELGTPVPMIYEKLSIFPWDDSEFLVAAQ